MIFFIFITFHILSISPKAVLHKEKSSFRPIVKTFCLKSNKAPVKNSLAKNMDLVRLPRPIYQQIDGKVFAHTSRYLRDSKTIPFAHRRKMFNYSYYKENDEFFIFHGTPYWAEILTSKKVRISVRGINGAGVYLTDLLEVARRYMGASRNCGAILVFKALPQKSHHFVYNQAYLSKVDIPIEEAYLHGIIFSKGDLFRPNLEKLQKIKNLPPMVIYRSTAQLKVFKFSILREREIIMTSHSLESSSDGRMFKNGVTIYDISLLTVHFFQTETIESLMDSLVKSSYEIRQYLSCKISNQYFFSASLGDSLGKEWTVREYSLRGGQFFDEHIQAQQLTVSKKLFYLMIIFLKRPLLSSERNLLQSVYHWLKKYQKNIFKSEEEYKKFMYFTHQDVIRKSLDGSRSIQGDLGILKLLSTSVGMSQLELWNLLLILYQVENRIRSCDFDLQIRNFTLFLEKNYLCTGYVSAKSA